MFTDILKKETLKNHQELEKILVTRIKEIKSAQHYLSVLQLFYTYFGALERRIEPFVDQEEFKDYNQRRKVNLLVADIKAFGGQPEKLANQSYLPDINDKFDACGSLYVMEGSTHGGKIISRMIAKHLNLTDSGGLSFFTGYGDETDRMWIQFKQTLNNAATDINDQAAIILSANNTFEKFTAWIEKNSWALAIQT